MEQKIVISVQRRNELVEEYLWCIDTVIRRNRLLLELARLDRDDVYQDLALRMIRAITGYEPSKGPLKTHILCQLQYELLNCKSSRKRYGFKNAPYDLRGAVVSMESLMECDPYWESRIAA